MEKVSLNYRVLSSEVENTIIDNRNNNIDLGLAFDERNVVRRDNTRDCATIIRTPFIRDIDKILNCPYYNRYANKTQVFSFYKNDDISRRGLHVQLVSRIARTIGNALGLNLDLIEAIALGHDIGHTPFGHAGERILDEIYYSNTHRHFSHNIHSVRVLDKIFPYNISLQTLDGIACHDGEMELSSYYPKKLKNFDEFDKNIEKCYLDKSNVKKLIPCTLEGCVVRISDIIAYLGKDRQDARRAKIANINNYKDCIIGTVNAEIINNLVVSIVENSYGKNYIKLDEKTFKALENIKKENYTKIYLDDKMQTIFDDTIKPMMIQMYDKLLSDLDNANKKSPIYTHHIDYVNEAHYKRIKPYEQEEHNQIVVDYIASMTDDYFLDLYAFLFPNSDKNVEYIGYFS